jgi:5-(hydroxymethyl)furfural/furfural oxidase
VTSHRDVVIVGAGSAGAALAYRLSEDHSRSVLLLEAGPNHTSAETPESILGKSMFAALGESGRVWPDLTATCVEGQKPVRYERGRGVGGSSAVNATVAIRGLPSDYDRWAAAGATGWGWNDVRPAFDRVAEHIPAERRTEAEWSAFDRALASVCAVRGHPRVDSYETEGVLGLAPMGLTRRQGRRVSTNDAYLEPARSRPNLEIRGDVLVDRVQIESGRAVGVRTKDGDLKARHVVVSAGAIHSPAILLRSGLGRLRKGLGQNLGEHPLLLPAVDLEPSVLAPEGDTPSTGCLLRWSSGLEGCGEGDLQLGPLNHAHPELPGRVHLLAAVMEPFSTGEVRLVSEDPTVDPQIDFRLLSDPRDLERMRIVAREMLAVLTHPAIRSLATAVTLDEAGTTPEDLADAAALDAWLRATVRDYVHATGTCKMGAPDDPKAVVDPRCRFIGVENLSVVDASIMPAIPRANTHLTAVMIAERAAAFIG